MQNRRGFLKQGLLASLATLLPWSWLKAEAPKRKDIFAHPKPYPLNLSYWAGRGAIKHCPNWNGTPIIFDSFFMNVCQRSEDALPDVYIEFGSLEGPADVMMDFCRTFADVQNLTDKVLLVEAHHPDKPFFRINYGQQLHLPLLRIDAPILTSFALNPQDNVRFVKASHPRWLANKVKMEATLMPMEYLAPEDTRFGRFKPITECGPHHYFFDLDERAKLADKEHQLARMVEDACTGYIFDEPKA